MKFHSVMIALVLAFAAPAASAFTLSTPGSACQPRLPDNASETYYQDGSVRTFSSTDVECPVPRETGGIQMTVYVDFFFNGTQTASCTIVVYDRDNSPLTATTVTKTGSGWQRGSATFSAAQNPSWAYTSADCALNNPSQRILGITAAY